MNWKESEAPSFIECVRQIHKYGREKLLNNYLCGDSTGQLHRATENIERAATARVVEHFESILHQYDEAEAA